MGGSVSEIIRKKVVKKVEEGMSRVAICKAYDVSMRSIERWMQLYRRTGDVKAEHRGFYKPRKVDKEVLKRKLEEKPDATLKELAEHFNCCPQNIDHWCKKLSITRKKNHSIRREKRKKATEISF